MDIPDFLPTDINPDFHLVISQIDGEFFACPSRKVSRIYLMGVLSEVLAALGHETCPHIDPDYSPLNYAISVIRLANQPSDDEGESEANIS